MSVSKLSYFLLIVKYFSSYDKKNIFQFASDIIISVNCLDLQFALFQPLGVFTFLFDRCLEFFLAEADSDKSIICA